MKLTPDSLRAFRTTLDISQGELARRIGISASLLGAIERQERALTSVVECRLRDALQVNEDDFAAFLHAYDRLKQIAKGK